MGYKNYHLYYNVNGDAVLGWLDQLSTASEDVVYVFEQINAPSLSSALDSVENFGLEPVPNSKAIRREYGPHLADIVGLASPGVVIEVKLQRVI